ncbi:hypothetical protein LCGC14_1971370 [marine sediment metagenome]|uniref:Uncharacterized protein n=1 Tax=marine sediment metagenome TaxID=412755 RepID=A0A0F9FZU6_9ZZZZ
MKEFDWDKSLWKTNEVRRDAAFLKRLAKWILRLSGNVNVAQRLNVIAIKLTK